MFDEKRLFKVLRSVTREQNYFILAQDLTVILSSILSQFAGLESTISDYDYKMQTLRAEEGKKAEGEVEQYRQAIISMTALLRKRAIWETIFTELLGAAGTCWYCAPVDNARSTNHSLSALDMWMKYSNDSFSVDPETRETIDMIKAKCTRILDDMFPDMLILAAEEDDIENMVRSHMTNRQVEFSDELPAGLLRDFEATNNSIYVVSGFPISHYHLVEPKFARLLKFSRARMLACPLISFIVNTERTTNVVDALNSEHYSIPSSTVLFYRSATRDVIVVHWEICSSLLSGLVLARGVDITREISASRSTQAENMQVLLRQWLHSIRNASFEQQAALIHDDVKGLADKVTALGQQDLADEFKGILTSLRTLIYTAHASVGLIDQALASKESMALNTIADFVESLAKFAPAFARAEGLAEMPSNFHSYLNGKRISSKDLRDLYVAGDMFSLKLMVDNIYSNAVRYTDPQRGVSGDVCLHVYGSMLQCVVNVTDFCPGGLPDEVVAYFCQHLGRPKVTDRRNVYCDGNPAVDEGNEVESESMPWRRRENQINSLECVRSAVLSFGSTDTDDPYSKHPSHLSDRSSPSCRSLMGVPHIVDLYHKLTSSGEQDFDMAITTSIGGTSYILKFSSCLIAPPKAETQETGTPQLERLHMYLEENEMKVLVVDDSNVIRRLLARFLDRLCIPYHLCVDGSDALNWFQNNHASCFGVITDMEMPHMGGTALIREVKALCPHLPCVVVTGNHLASDQTPIGAMDVLLKPIMISQLREILLRMYEPILDVKVPVTTPT